VRGVADNPIGLTLLDGWSRNTRYAVAYRLHAPAGVRAEARMLFFGCEARGRRVAREAKRLRDSAVESRTSRIPNEPLEMMRRFWAGRSHGRSGANPFFTWNTLMCLLPHEQALECPVAKPRRKTEDGSAGDGWSCAPRSLSSESTTAQLTAAPFPQSHLKLSPVQGLVWRPQKAAT